MVHGQPAIREATHSLRDQGSEAPDPDRDAAVRGQGVDAGIGDAMPTAVVLDLALGPQGDAGHEPELVGRRRGALGRGLARRQPGRAPARARAGRRVARQELVVQRRAVPERRLVALRPLLAAEAGAATLEDKIAYYGKAVAAEAMDREPEAAEAMEPVEAVEAVPAEVVEA